MSNTFRAIISIRNLSERSQRRITTIDICCCSPARPNMRQSCYRIAMRFMRSALILKLLLPAAERSRLFTPTRVMQSPLFTNTRPSVTLAFTLRHAAEGYGYCQLRANRSATRASAAVYITSSIRCLDVCATLRHVHYRRQDEARCRAAREPADGWRA